MGQCSSIENRLSTGPHIIRLLSEDRLEAIISEKLQPYQMHLSDREYGIYSRLNLEEFLQSDPIRYLQAIRGSFDVANFAFLLIGEERKWLSSNRPGVTSTFGYAVGKIYKEEELHPIQVVNCYLDPENELWFIDPRTFQLFKAEEGSKIEFIVF